MNFQNLSRSSYRERHGWNNNSQFFYAFAFKYWWFNKIFIFLAGSLQKFPRLEKLTKSKQESQEIISALESVATRL